MPESATLHTLTISRVIISDDSIFAKRCEARIMFEQSICRAEA